MSFEESKVAIVADLKQSGSKTLGVLDVLETSSWHILIDGKI
jgi:hypothetical protein